MRNSTRIARLSRSDKPQFVSVISSAFARDPLFMHLFGNSLLENKARNHAAAFVSFMFDKSFLIHEEIWGIYEHDDLLGAYIVEKPLMNTLQRIRGGMLLMIRFLPLLFRLSGKSRRFLNDYIRVTRSAIPPWKHYYLIMIGIRSESQGKGIGKQLLNHLLNTVNGDPNVLGVALDTENPDNIPVYERFSFALSKQTPLDPIRIYCMHYRKDSPLAEPTK